MFRVRWLTSTSSIFLAPVKIFKFRLFNSSYIYFYVPSLDGAEDDDEAPAEAASAPCGGLGAEG